MTHQCNVVIIDNAQETNRIKGKTTRKELNKVEPPPKTRSNTIDQNSNGLKQLKAKNYNDPTGRVHQGAAMRLDIFFRLKNK